MGKGIRPTSPPSPVLHCIASRRSPLPLALLAGGIPLGLMLRCLLVLQQPVEKVPLAECLRMLECRLGLDFVENGSVRTKGMETTAGWLAPGLVTLPLLLLASL